MAGVIVPHRRLSAAALAAVVEEYVSRDGTELTDAAPKAGAVVELLDRGELLLVYDSDSDSCNIVRADDAALPGDAGEIGIELDP